MTDEAGKVCEGPCGQWKPFAEFHKDRTQKDGYKKFCKPCRSDKQKEYRSSQAHAPTEEDMITSRARQMALKRLAQNHKQELLNLIVRYKRELGAKPRWIKMQ